MGFLLRRHCLATAVTLIAVLLGGCGQGDGSLRVAVIGSRAAALAGTEARPVDPAALSDAARLLRAATVVGLVGFDGDGRVVPGLADRWIVAADGLSYIFRLRDGTWPDGSAVRADQVAAELRRVIAAQDGTGLGVDLSIIDDVRVMAGRVIEIDLAGPEPDLLSLLAQPELGIGWKRGGSGPMLIKAGSGAVLLELPPPGLNSDPVADAGERRHPLLVDFAGAQGAVQKFNAGEADAVLGGTIASLPLAGFGRLTRGNVQLDPVIGLFGLEVVNADGFLADFGNRAAIDSVIDRDALVAAFNIGGWEPTTRLVSKDATGAPASVGERWTLQSLADRRKAAASLVARYAAAAKTTPVLRLALPDGPGSSLVADRLRADFVAIGLGLRVVGTSEAADLRLIDEVATYLRPEWFLDRFACAAHPSVCNPAADIFVNSARRSTDPAQRSAYLVQAETSLTSTEVYIPLARPLRWSMIRGSVAGFTPNPLGWHPLPSFAAVPR